MKPKWPKEVRIFLHSSKEGNIEIGESIGLSEDALQLFKYAACEIELIVSVAETGEAKIVGIKEEK